MTWDTPAPASPDPEWLTAMTAAYGPPSHVLPPVHVDAPGGAYRRRFWTWLRPGLGRVMVIIDRYPSGRRVITVSKGGVESCRAQLDTIGLAGGEAGQVRQLLDAAGLLAPLPAPGDPAPQVTL